jgi:hypothetical protein
MPLRNPFKQIPNLEKILYEEEALERKRRQLKPLEVQLTLDDTMMSRKQYQELFNNQHLDQADAMLLKLR